MSRPPEPPSPRDADTDAEIDAYLEEEATWLAFDDLTEPPIAPVEIDDVARPDR